MLRSLVIFSFCLIAINASGEFSVLNYPSSLDFKGSEKLDSESLGDVLSASLGYWVDDGTRWSGLYVNDPFNTAKSAVAVVVTGVDHINLNTKAKSYGLIGSSSQDALNALSSELESSNLFVSSLDFSQLNDALVSFSDLFGAPSQVSPIKATNSLKPDLHSEDKEFLTQISYLNEAADKYATLKQCPAFLTIYVSLAPIAKAHGEKSAAMSECLKLVSNVIENLSVSVKRACKGEGLMVVIAEKADLTRAKREVVEPNTTNQLNLATYYNDDYPVIFNIILWFMVIFGFSLLAICYAIGSMDPGRDSIIYRMTSTRMKKDN